MSFLRTRGGTRTLTATWPTDLKSVVSTIPPPKQAPHYKYPNDIISLEPLTGIEPATY